MESIERSIENLVIDFFEYRKLKRQDTTTEDIKVDEEKLEQKPAGEKIPFKDELKYIKLLYSEISKVLDPYITDIVNEYDYEGSPIYNQYVDRETIGQIVSKVIESSKDEVYQIEEIYLSDEFENWGEKALFKQIIEVMVLYEIYTTKRYEMAEYNKNDIIEEDVEVTEPVNEVEELEPVENIDTTEELEIDYNMEVLPGIEVEPEVETGEDEDLEDFVYFKKRNSYNLKNFL